MDAFVVTPNEFLICGESMFSECAPAELHRLLGEPTTISAGRTPAPAGHRNNQIHLWHNRGLYSIEHHARRLLQGVGFVFNNEEAPHGLQANFSESLVISGFPIRSGMSEKELSAIPLGFRGALAGSWTHSEGSLHLFLSTAGRKRPGRRRTKTRYLTDVYVSFERVESSE